MKSILPKRAFRLFETDLHVNLRRDIFQCAPYAFTMPPHFVTENNPMNFKHCLTAALAITLLTGSSFAADSSALDSTFNGKKNLASQKDNQTTHTKWDAWYFSWGYNKDYWTNSDIHVSQPGLNNNFTVHDVTATDDPGWNDGLFNTDLMSPQYNIRIGHFINADRTYAVELSFDHTKYNTNFNQVARVSGTINGVPTNGNQVLSPTYFNYMLHNGANELMINFVRLNPFWRIPHTPMRLSAVNKIGAGVMIPHAENTIFGNQSNVGPKAWGNYFGLCHGWWQLSGWTAGVEFGLQLGLYKGVYLEFTDKEAYTDLMNIPVYQGRASQTVWLNELILNLGTRF